ncbi:hypothetical protein CEXT_759311 [Caerostris extrusa]|uniref:Uncharacterized protein n=1 Tax=Caerostris extrusa TaxID=172846 RepID=A0AAV4VLN8_CAEEX|nr:hypothetical protein CEXT_759311 [Caerostris extrusa]
MISCKRFLAQIVRGWSKSISSPFHLSKCNALQFLDGPSPNRSPDEQCHLSEAEGTIQPLRPSGEKRGRDPAGGVGVHQRKRRRVLPTERR